MTRTLPILAALAALTLSACSVNPQAAAERRAALNERLLPNPADRQGVRLIFPFGDLRMGSTIEVIYYADEVSEPQILSRMNRFCSRFKTEAGTAKVYLEKRLEDRTVTMSDGTVKPTKTVFVTCDVRQA